MTDQRDPSGEESAVENGQESPLPKGAASNTEAAFRELIGGTVVGILRDALPHNQPDLARGNTTLVMHDGSGFTFASNGSYWRENPDEMAHAIHKMMARWNDAKQTYDRLLALAGRRAPGRHA